MNTISAGIPRRYRSFDRFFTNILKIKRIGPFESVRKGSAHPNVFGPGIRSLEEILHFGLESGFERNIALVDEYLNVIVHGIFDQIDYGIIR